MKQKIPFSIIPFNRLKRLSKPFSPITRKLEIYFPSLNLFLKNIEMNVNPFEFINMCFLASLVFYVFSSIILTIFLFLFQIESFVTVSLTVAIPLTLFILLQQLLYPKLKSNRRIKDIDKNLLAALEHIMINLNSGVPLFNTIVAISSENFGEVTVEFKKAVKKINAGEPQLDVLNQMADENPSLFFRRALWQLVNGMKSGADVAVVIKDIISALSEEQLIQIESYGGKLKSLAMFYMIVAVILPSLGMTFLIVISSFIGTSETVSKIIFWGLYAFVLFAQIMFLAMLKTIRPTLLGS